MNTLFIKDQAYIMGKMQLAKYKADKERIQKNPEEYNADQHEHYFNIRELLNLSMSLRS